MKNKAEIHLKNDCLFVSGDVDFSTAVGLWSDSLPLLTHCQKLAFDFSKVTTVTNSAALALLLEWLKLAACLSKPVVFQHLPPQLLSIAAVAGIDKLLISYS